MTESWVILLLQSNCWKLPIFEDLFSMITCRVGNRHLARFPERRQVQLIVPETFLPSLPLRDRPLGFEHLGTEIIEVDFACHS